MILTFLLVTLAFGLIIFLEAPSLISKKKWRELGAFTVLLVPAIIYGYGLIFDLKLPNPSRFIESLFQPLATMLGPVLGAGL
ncbi:hypothetical protein [Desulforamulus aquiferis]|uniref:hypothetical protein n=1 Tax=Desulforamulus aquiferis TaxID=1397668 RepID=UPI0035715438